MINTTHPPIVETFLNITAFGGDQLSAEQDSESLDLTVRVANLGQMVLNTHAMACQVNGEDVGAELRERIFEHLSGLMTKCREDVVASGKVLLDEANFESIVERCSRASFSKGDFSATFNLTDDVELCLSARSAVLISTVAPVSAPVKCDAFRDFYQSQ